jgi:hypothetical protein
VDSLAWVHAGLQLAVANYKGPTHHHVTEAFGIGIKF